MSQAGSLTGGGSVAPDIETLTGDAGGAVSPDAAFNIDLLGGNNITTTGNPGANSISFAVTGTTNHALQLGNATGSLTSLGVATNGQLPIGAGAGSDPVLSTLTAGTGITITNGAGSITISASAVVEGTGQTIGAVTDDVITIAMGAIPSTYVILAVVAAYESTGPNSAGYRITACAKTTGAAATIVGTPDVFAFEDAALNLAEADVVASANNLIIRVTGVAGLTIDWSARTEEIIQA